MPKVFFWHLKVLHIVSLVKLSMRGQCGCHDGQTACLARWQCGARKKQNWLFCCENKIAQIALFNLCVISLPGTLFEIYRSTVCTKQPIDRNWNKFEGNVKAVTWIIVTAMVKIISWSPFSGNSGRKWSSAATGPHIINSSQLTGTGDWSSYHLFMLSSLSSGSIDTGRKWAKGSLL